MENSRRTGQIWHSRIWHRTKFRFHFPSSISVVLEGVPFTKSLLCSFIFSLTWNTELSEQMTQNKNFASSCIFGSTRMDIHKKICNHCQPISVRLHISSQVYRQLRIDKYLYLALVLPDSKSYIRPKRKEQFSLSYKMWRSLRCIKRFTLSFLSKFLAILKSEFYHEEFVRTYLDIYSFYCLRKPFWWQ